MYVCGCGYMGVHACMCMLTYTDVYASNTYSCISQKYFIDQRSSQSINFSRILADTNLILNKIKQKKKI